MPVIIAFMLVLVLIMAIKQTKIASLERYNVVLFKNVVL